MIGFHENGLKLNNQRTRKGKDSADYNQRNGFQLIDQDNRIKSGDKMECDQN